MVVHMLGHHQNHLTQCQFSFLVGVISKLIRRSWFVFFFFFDFFRRRIVVDVELAYASSASYIDDCRTRFDQFLFTSKNNCLKLKNSCWQYHSPEEHFHDSKFRLLTNFTFLLFFFFFFFLISAPTNSFFAFKFL